MKKYVIMFFIFFSSDIFALTPKAIFCPDVTQLKVNGPPFAFYVTGKNTQNKIFESKPFQFCNYCDVEYKIDRLNELNSNYIDSKKELDCVYEGHFEFPFLPNEPQSVTVINNGDY